MTADSGVPLPSTPDLTTLQRRAHDLIPGGGHTYAKGDDQYPLNAPAFIVRGSGCHVWDAAGREFIEYGMGLRAVTLGHAHPAVVAAAYRAMRDGCNFTRPTPLEVECAEELLALIPGADMVKFAKNGSDVTTAAVKLARAATGRDLVAVCGDQPFFSTDDWFIGVTAMNAGVPRAVRDLTVQFRFNDLDGLRSLFDRHDARIACVVLEPATSIEPEAGFLQGVRDLCSTHGALLVFDEMITGFRWGLHGAQGTYGVTPDLSAFGKGMANGFAASALTGRRDLMEHGGLRAPGDRVFLLSTTHGAESVGLAAALETMRLYRREPVIETLYRQGERLRAGVLDAARSLDLGRHFTVEGRACNLIFVTRDAAGERSQIFRTLFMQEIIKRGVVGPSFVVSYSHTDDDVDRTIAAVEAALRVYRRALDDGVDHYLEGRPVKPVFRRRD
jgi:glutamate-1-semialdehyde 2,1-aminomutase